MWFRKSSSGPSRQEHILAETQAQENAFAGERALQMGRLPPHIESRLRESRQNGLPWTSTLSVSEFALLSKWGLRPISQVMGVSYYHVQLQLGLDLSYAYDSYVMTGQEQAVREGFELAQKRLIQEAQILGASAIVGVKMRIEPGEGPHERQFIMAGTAVTMTGSNIPTPSVPVVCTGSLQDFAKLLSTGAMPVGLAIGVGVYYQYSTYQDMRQLGSWNNREIPAFTSAIYQVRHRAMRQMIQDVSSVRPSHILAHTTHFSVEDIEVERGENDTRIDHIVQFTVIGTAVDSSFGSHSDKPMTMLNLGR